MGHLLQGLLFILWWGVGLDPSTLKDFLRHPQAYIQFYEQNEDRFREYRTLIAACKKNIVGKRLLQSALSQPEVNQLRAFMSAVNTFNGVDFE